VPCIKTTKKSYKKAALLKKRYEEAGYSVVWYISTFGRLGLLVFVDFYSNRDIFTDLTRIGGDLLFEVYREHKGFAVRKQYVF
jgi:hypothetical protein